VQNVGRTDGRTDGLLKPKTQIKEEKERKRKGKERKGKGKERKEKEGQLTGNLCSQLITTCSLDYIHDLRQREERARENGKRIHRQRHCDKRPSLWWRIHTDPVAELERPVALIDEQRS
jgi:hypothetical protein